MTSQLRPCFGLARACLEDSAAIASPKCCFEVDMGNSHRKWSKSDDANGCSEGLNQTSRRGIDSVPLSGLRCKKLIRDNRDGSDDRCMPSYRTAKHDQPLQRRTTLSPISPALQMCASVGPSARSIPVAVQSHQIH